MQLLGSILVDGVAYGMILFMISVGFSITMGLMRVVNLAHGAFALIGGYLAASAMQAAGLGYAFAVAAAVIGTAVIAVPVERLLFRRIYRRSELDQVLLTIGIIFVAIAGAGSIYGNSLVPIHLPEYLKTPVDLGFRVMPMHRLAALIVGVATLAIIWLALGRTTFGVHVRAAVDNASAAEGLGINTGRVYSITFAFGAALAALGGIVGAELLPLEPTYPIKYLVLFLAVVAVGGMGSLYGAFAAALLLGIIETAAKYLVSDLASILFFATMLVVLTIRPQGLFGRAH